MTLSSCSWVFMPMQKRRGVYKDYEYKGADDLGVLLTGACFSPAQRHDYKLLRYFKLLLRKHNLFASRNTSPANVHHPIILLHDLHTLNRRTVACFLPLIDISFLLFFFVHHNPINKFITIINQAFIFNVAQKQSSTFLASALNTKLCENGQSTIVLGIEPFLRDLIIHTLLFVELA